MYLEFENLNCSVIGLSKLLLEKGVRRSTRGFDCIEYQQPLLIKIKNSYDNVITIPERKWAKTLPFAESLWIASGTNHLGLVEKYAPGINQYSDDQKFMRAAYGTRLRSYSGIATDYKLDKPFKKSIVGYIKTVDQLRFVIESLKRDMNSRQALITIHDVVKDDFDEHDNLKVTKDTPCCRTIQFLINDGKLDCILTIRSNDVHFGFSAVNVFNFTWMQHYVANILGVEVGSYFHFVANLHYYSDKQELTEKLANLNPSDYHSEFGKFQYFDNFTLEEFDKKIIKLFNYEEGLRTGQHEELLTWRYQMFYDWAAVFYKYWTKNKVTFINPYLHKLFNGN